MKIPPQQQENFETLCMAASVGDLYLLPTKLAATGEAVDVICVGLDMDQEVGRLIPMAVMFRADLVEKIVPPEHMKVQYIDPASGLSMKVN